MSTRPSQSEPPRRTSRLGSPTSPASGPVSAAAAAAAADAVATPCASEPPVGYRTGPYRGAESKRNLPSWTLLQIKIIQILGIKTEIEQTFWVGRWKL